MLVTYALTWGYGLLPMWWPNLLASVLRAVSVDLSCLSCHKPWSEAMCYHILPGYLAFHGTPNVCSVGACVRAHACARACACDVRAIVTFMRGDRTYVPTICGRDFRP